MMCILTDLFQNPAVSATKLAGMAVARGTKSLCLVVKLGEKESKEQTAGWSIATALLHPP